MACESIEQTAQVKDIVFVPGDYLSITMTVDGVDLTDYTITWDIGDITGTVTIDDPTSGIAVLSIDSATSATIENGSSFVVAWDDDNALHRTIWIGKIRHQGGTE